MHGARSEHLKTEHTESLFLLRRHLGNWPRSKHEKRTAGSAWETWTVAAADGVRCAGVSWEINFLLIFETAPFICERTVYDTLCVHVFKIKCMTVRIVHKNNTTVRESYSLPSSGSAYWTFAQHVDSVVQDPITYHMLLPKHRDCWHAFPVNGRSLPNLITFTAITYSQSWLIKVSTYSQSIRLYALS